ASHLHRRVATPRVDFVSGQIVWPEPCTLINLLRHHDFAAERLGQLLEAGGDIDGIADHRELRMALVADIAGNGDARIDADPEPDGFEQRVSERAVERLDPSGDRGAGGDRLSARDFRS